MATKSCRKHQTDIPALLPALAPTLFPALFPALFNSLLPAPFPVFLSELLPALFLLSNPAESNRSLLRCRQIADPADYNVPTLQNAGSFILQGLDSVPTGRHRMPQDLLTFQAQTAWRPPEINENLCKSL